MKVPDSQQLISKIQYNNFEPGEFAAEEPRNYNQTIALIESFPWEAQRDHLKINLTNPSVSIQDNQGNYLKLALFYNGRFVIHYFTPDNSLYTKSLASYTEAYPFIQSFYNGSLDISTFKKESTWFQDIALHFIDQDFHYTANSTRIRINMSLMLAYCIILLILIIAACFRNSTVQGKALIFFFFTPFQFIFSFYFATLINHYMYIRNKVLIMSKGNDIFYFGKKDSPEKFDKKDITEILIEGAKDRNSSQPGLQKISIAFSDGRFILLSGLLIGKTRLLDKLQGLQYQEISRVFTFISPSS